MSSVNICYCSVTAPPLRKKLAQHLVCLQIKKIFFTHFMPNPIILSILNRCMNIMKQEIMNIQWNVSLKYAIYTYMSVSTFIKKKEKTPVAQKRTSVHYYLEFELHYKRNNVIEY